MTDLIRPHPAVYSPQILAAIAERIPDGSLVLDPFAGIGTIHQLDGQRGIRTIGVEIEPEWACANGNTLRGDATNLAGNWSDRFDVVATSPCYGNRMADHHEARDSSKRVTYRHVLGRMPSERSTAVLQWTEDDYKLMHERAWREAWRVTRPGGRFLLNVKDHIRKGELQHVPEWHLKICQRIGWTVAESLPIPVAGMRFGQNHAARVDHEWLYVMEKSCTS